MRQIILLNLYKKTLEKQNHLLYCSRYCIEATRKFLLFFYKRFINFTHNYKTILLLLYLLKNIKKFNHCFAINMKYKSGCFSKLLYKFMIFQIIT